MTTQEIAEGIYQHAHTNYNVDGWDWIASCWSMKELITEIKDCSTLESGIEHMHEYALMMHNFEFELR